MSLWRHIRLGLRGLMHHAEVAEKIDEEVRHYLDQAEAELVASGTSPEEARRTVRLRYGDGLAAREEVGSYGWENLVVSVWTDVRLAGRRLVRDPGFSVIAVLTLGLGIGATTAIVSAVRPVLFDALPYLNANRIVVVADRSEDGTPVPVTFGTYLEVRSRSGSFDELAAYKPWQPTLTWAQDAERLEGQRVGAEYFGVLGATPFLGAGFDPEADRPGGPDLVILSHRLWALRFGSDPTIVGRTVRLDGTAFTVTGVMGPNFENATAPLATVWSLLQYEPVPASFDSREWGHHLQMFGRLKAGLGLDEAYSRIEAVAANPAPDFVRPVWASLKAGLSIRSLRESATRDARPTMLVLLGAASLLLGIACVNLTILLLARGARRQGEIAMRMALGASRSRLARYLLTESLVLAALGAGVGVIVAQPALAGLLAVSPPSLAQTDTVGLDVGALLVAVVLPTLISVIFGLGPVVVRAGRTPLRGIQSTHRGSIRGTLSARRALVVTEVAFAAVLLVGAGLLLRSTQRLFAIEPGFDATGVVVLQVSTTALGRGDDVVHRFYREALEAVRDVPGVRAAGVTSQLPLSGDVDMYGLTLHEPGRALGGDGSAYRYAVTPGYLDVMGVELMQGRHLDRRDDDAASRAAVVSESLARRLFPYDDPIGSRLQFGAAIDRPYTVVGVVEDVKQESLGAVEAEAVYVPSDQWHWADRVRWIVVQANGDTEALVPSIREAIRRVDPNQPVVRVQSMTDLVARSETQRRFVSTVLAAFAMSALLLAGVGLFGVLSGSVTERAREIGVRGALGASRTDIVALVIRNGISITGLGLVVGLGAAAAATEALSTLLFDVSRLDPLTYLGVFAILSAVALVACWVPATRAARLDPASTLRAS